MEEKKGTLNYDDYRYGELANRFFQTKEGQIHVKSSLEKLVQETGADKNARAFVEGTYATKEGLATAAKVGAEDYAEAFGSLTIKDIYQIYESTIQFYLGKDTQEFQNAKAEFEKFRDETYNSILEKLEYAETMIKDGKTLKHSQEEIDEAERIKEKYTKLFTYIKILEDRKFEGLRPDVVDRTYKNYMKELASEKKAA